MPFPEMCRCCGRTDLEIVLIIRKRVHGLAETRWRTILMMYVIRTGRCPGCGALSTSHTDAIPGTSLGPRLCATIQAYERAHNTEQDMRLVLAEIDGIVLSARTISGCITVTADHSDWDVLSSRARSPLYLAPRTSASTAARWSRRDVPNTEYHR